MNHEISKKKNSEASYDQFLFWLKELRALSTFTHKNIFEFLRNNPWSFSGSIIS